MLFMSGICGVLAILALMTKSLSRRNRRILAAFEAAAMLLLVFDRYAYLYRGDPSTAGYWMVRISNFMVFFLSLFILHCITLAQRQRRRICSIWNTVRYVSTAARSVKTHERSNPQLCPGTLPWPGTAKRRLP